MLKQFSPWFSLTTPLYLLAGCLPGFSDANQKTSIFANPQILNAFGNTQQNLQKILRTPLRGHWRNSQSDRQSGSSVCHCFPRKSAKKRN